MSKISFFIIGLPRSGAKLLRIILNKHPDIFIADIEILFIPRMLENMVLRKGSKKVLEHLKNV